MLYVCGSKTNNMRYASRHAKSGVITKWCHYKTEIITRCFFSMIFSQMHQSRISCDVMFSFCLLLQVDLRNIKRLSQIATQCRADHPQCVTSYYVNVKSFANDEFTAVCGHPTCPQLFIGNELTDNLELVVVNTFDWLVTARFVRVNPQSWAVFVSMRWELYGCC